MNRLTRTCSGCQRYVIEADARLCLSRLPRCGRFAGVATARRNPAL